MRNITLRLADETIAELEDEADEYGVSRSEHLRNLVESRDEHDGNTDEYTERIEQLERENERLHRERRQLLEQREENTELVRYAREQRSIEREREDWRRERESANILRKTWWVLAGRPTADSD